jgi:hypothetical protein
MGAQNIAANKLTVTRTRIRSPLSRRRCVRTLTLYSQMPFPVDGTAQDRDLWFLSQLGGIRELALRNRKLNVALMALREMREVTAVIKAPQNRDDPDWGLRGLLPSPQEEGDEGRLE